MFECADPHCNKALNHLGLMYENGWVLVGHTPVGRAVWVCENHKRPKARNVNVDARGKLIEEDVPMVTKEQAMTANTFHYGECKRTEEMRWARRWGGCTLKGLTDYAEKLERELNEMRSRHPENSCSDAYPMLRQELAQAQQELENYKSRMWYGLARLCSACHNETWFLCGSADKEKGSFVGEIWYCSRCGMGNQVKERTW